LSISPVSYTATILIAVTLPTEQERSPRYAEQALNAIHAAMTPRERIALEYGIVDGEAVLLVRFPRPLRDVVLTQLAAAYPDAKLVRQPEDAPPQQRLTRSLRLKPDLYPLRRYVQFEEALERVIADPLSGVLSALATIAIRDGAPRVQLVLSPVSLRLLRRAQRAVEMLQRRRVPFADWYATHVVTGSIPSRLMAVGLATIARRHDGHIERRISDRHDGEDVLDAAMDKVQRRLFCAQLRIGFDSGGMNARDREASLRILTAAFGQFTAPGRVDFVQASRRRDFLLSTEEAASLWHAPTTTVQSERTARSLWREREPPTSLRPYRNDGDSALLGRVAYRRRSELVPIQAEDRLRHLHIVGKTGMGKSTLLLNLLASDIAAGRGAGLIDPHGDLADAILENIPRRRTNDIVLLDSGEPHTLAWNPLRCTDERQRPLVASGVLSAFKKLYGDSWGPRLEHILRNALLTVLDQPNATLQSVLRLLSDTRYRQSAIDHVTDPLVRSFWIDEFSRWNDRYRTEAIAPIQNKVGQVLSSPQVRAIIASPKSRLDLRALMDEERIFIVNLSKGRTGEDASALLGALLISSLQLAAMSRADAPAEQRRPFYLCIDEFQNFATDSFATILSEARKYGLALTLAHQYLDQLDEATAQAVFGNAGSLVCFQSGSRDADAFSEQLGRDLTPADLIALPRFTAYVRLLIDGMPSRPFSIRTLPPAKRNGRQSASTVRNVSRRQYAPANS